MTSDQTIELRDLIDQLTAEHPVAVYQHGELLRYRTDPPLLNALRDARTGNIGNAAGGSGAAAHERTTMNIAASEQYSAITKRVRGWAIAAEVPRHWQLAGNEPVDWTDPAKLLRAWHTRALSDPHFDERPYTSTLRGWIGSIQDMCVDPPRRWALEAPCPLCNQRWAIDADGQQVDTLAVTERDPVDQSVIVCRNCDAVWNGLNAARELRIAIDDAAAKTAA